MDQREALLRDLKILPNRRGSRTYTKSSHPVRYGVYTEVHTKSYTFHYNLKGQIKTVMGTGSTWPHPAEWLKRTAANNWVYYSTGSYYTGVFDLFGEYYLPCPAYPTNILSRENPFSRPAVQEALDMADGMPAALSRLRASIDRRTTAPEVFAFLEQAERQDTKQLLKEAARRHDILGAPITVLPPDCRHVDYEVIPLILTQGCLYNCDFCRVKTPTPFCERSRDNIDRQLRRLQTYFGPDLVNYSSVFLGQHDALAASPELILFAAQRAYDLLEIAGSYMQGPRLFLFGSVDSFLDKKDDFFHALNRLPWHVHINLGLESFDGTTLTMLRKPLAAEKIRQTFVRCMELNRQLPNLEISTNIVLGEKLPASHLAALDRVLEDQTIPFTSRTTLYLSPLIGSTSTARLLDQFRKIKRKCHFESYLYLIQRL
jgi:hypothetical protein